MRLPRRRFLSTAGSGALPLPHASGGEVARAKPEPEWGKIRSKPGDPPLRLAPLGTSPPNKLGERKAPSPFPHYAISPRDESLTP